MDTTDPVIAGCPSDQTVQATNGQTAVVTWTPPTATDDITRNELVTPQLQGNQMPGSTFTVGQTTVTYTSTDGAGNSATCSFVITVTGMFICCRSANYIYTVAMSTLTVVHTSDQNDHNTKAMADQNSEQVHEP